MRNLSPTLLSAQSSASHIPYIQLEVNDKMTGVVRLKWERLYTGSESEYYHGLSMAGDGSLIRVRISPPSDGKKLYWQRVSNPGPQSDFSVWNYTGKYNCRAVAVASCGAEVSIFWLNSNQELWRFKSINYGANWGSAELLDYSSSTDINGLSASYKPNGDLAVFFTEQSTLYGKKCVGGSWQARSYWNKTTGELSGIAAVYQSDWNLLVAGLDMTGNCKIWSLVYGDGGDVSAGSWSALKEIASAPAGGDFEFCGVFLDKPDIYRAFYTEKFNGVQNYGRPMGTHSVPDSSFVSNLWREPLPFNLACQYGMAIAHYGNYCWLSTANGVWRAGLSAANIDITDKLLSLKYESSGEEGQLVVELRNDEGTYQFPGEGDLTALNIGSQIEFSPGYSTSQGNEVSTGPAFWINGWEYISSGSKSNFILHCIDGWGLLENWQARHQFRWNKDSNEMSVKQILEFVLARVGLKLEVKSQSPVITSFYPDFTIQPDDSGITIVRRLLSFVPDFLFMEGVKAYLVNPQSSDDPVYSYGQAHAIIQGKYQTDGWQINQVRIEGYDEISKQSIIVDSFSWEQLEHFYDRTRQVEDRNISTVAIGQARGDAYLRKAEIESLKGTILVPVNCVQQLYDVIDITDSRAGLSATKRRVREIVLSYCTERSEYTEKLLLGGV